jgi:hypothetical protein
MQQTKTELPYLKISLICLLVIYCFWSVIQQVTQARQLPDTDGPFFTEWEKRFEPIKESLPFTHGVIGYAADWDIPGVNYDPANTEAEHVLTQYTLTPIVVSRDTSHEWILVNMDAANFDTWLALQEGEFEVTRYKYNLYLLHRIQ